MLGYTILQYIHYYIKENHSQRMAKHGRRTFSETGMAAMGQRGVRGGGVVKEMKKKINNDR